MCDDEHGVRKEVEELDKSIVSLMYLSVLVNGASKSFIHTSRGLRQGAPLSPLLFNLRSEMLSKLVMKVASLGLLKGCKVVAKGPSILLL